MATEYSFVEVLMLEYQPGDKEYQSFFENEVHCFDGSWEDSTEEIKEVIEARAESERNRKEAESQGKNSYISFIVSSDPDLLITKPLTAFQFSYFGQSLDRYYSSGIDWEVSGMDSKYVFEGWLEDLRKIGHELLADKKAMNHPQAGSIIRFVTLWSYDTFKDSYTSEYSSEWELIGLVKPGQVKTLLDEEKAVESVL